ncbi:MAG: hypothetical protein A3I89_00020 [Candidatus Harrisonbacteria bacterium RIFCSPLOWO2_02_FULL_41_11]|uniref:SHS2 domain-containing protein n=1 Tax=Candidatus Harrisonbacteria bacterium RIFCSPHIGHO2_02_FULL_42_16 TaxID=1798404 RepID=A0A1G1ZFI8_9BACT|nr:MAG: hypothetical protein A3B92_03465 [Candidatus Harrisonbacteria bacterium RIFCSPHIGHO2_02_FULL_42_16]OGY66797.1 MAG: hypothetical protein A3I89_00020 [Candidatus Harrisonbacteria bacterium RIFCSPLOWO2_02_FULL_41_11]
MKFNFFGTKSYLGVDIGTTSIKLVELKKSKSAPELLNYGLLETYSHLERLNDAIQTSALKIDSRKTEELLKILLKNSGVKSRDAVASIPAFATFTSLLDMPIMPEKDMRQAMQFQAKQYVPLPISEVTIDWLAVGEHKDDKGILTRQILLISVPNEYIEIYKIIFRNTGLNLVALEIEGLSDARALTMDIDKLVLIINIGSRSTSFMIAKNGLMKAGGQTDFSGSSLTQTIASGLNIPVRKAEDLKKQRGLRGAGGEYELSTLMLPILDVIISEGQRLKDNYEQSSGEKIARIILSGGGANLIGIAAYIQNQTAIPTAAKNPFSQISYSSDIEPLIAELGPAFSVAVGLGLRQLI